jgi:S-adenosylmethionine hydrolase
LENISNTFHGRDIFAPAAAKIVADVPFNDFLNRISLKETVTFGDVKSFDFEENIIYIDEFGNIVLGIKHNAFLDKIKNMKWELNYKNLKFTKLNSNYFSVQKGDFLLLVNSLGYLEIACREDNAAEKLKAFVGDEFFIRVYR